MEEPRKFSISSDIVEIIHKKRPNSPSRNKKYITETKKLPQERSLATKRNAKEEPNIGQTSEPVKQIPTEQPKADERRRFAKRGLTGEPKAEERKGPISNNTPETPTADKRSIFDPSIPPVNTAGDGSQPKDFTNQVMATEILEPHSTQTGSSLRERTTELHKRRADRSQCKTSRKSWNNCCDKPRLCCGNKICSGDPRDFQAQADPREIGSSESVQTGPSLAASGSFCRFDYKLRKVKKWPADRSGQCECPSKPDYSTTCAQNGDGCDLFHQQVAATDILTSDYTQTGQKGEKCEEGDVLLYGSAKRQSNKAYRRKDTDETFFWCDCPKTGPASLGRRHFGSQVEPGVLSHAKSIQTERHLSNAIISSRKVRYQEWEQCQKKCRKGQGAAEGKKSVGLGVTPLDIADSTEMQTDDFVDPNEVYTRKREVCSGTKPKETVCSGRVREIGDDCVLFDRQSAFKNVKVVEQATQVSVLNIANTSGYQTK